MPTAFAVPANNVVAIVGPGGYTAGSGTLTLAAGQGAQFPALSGNAFYILTVVQQAHAYDPLATSAQLTIYKATARSGDTFTGLTVAEGTTDRNYVGGDVVDVRVTAGKLSGIQAAINALENVLFLCQGRLTIAAGDPVNIAGVAAGSGTVYFSPYKGNRIALYDGSIGWNTIPFAETGIAVPSSAAIVDVFAWNNGGTMNLELSQPWSASGFATALAGTRTDALAKQDGIYVKQANPTRRYLGTFSAQAGTVTYDYIGTIGTPAKRMVWNYYNRVRKYWYCEQNVSNWTYGTAAWRLFNNNVGGNSQAMLMYGLAEDTIDLVAHGSFSSGPGIYFVVGILYDNTTNPAWVSIQDGSITVAIYGNVEIVSSHAMHQGLHYYGGAEYASGGTLTVYAQGNGTSIKGWIWC